MKLLPTRIPILYVILGVLLAISVVPIYFYSLRVEQDMYDRLSRNEKMMQMSVTQGIAGDVSQRANALRLTLQNLGSAVNVASGGNLTDQHVASPELRALLEHFVSANNDVVYVTLVNADGKGITAGRVQPDSFMQREFERAFSAAREGRPYMGQPLAVAVDKNSRVAAVFTEPLTVGGRFIGVVATVVDLQFIVDGLRQLSTGGLDTYVVDREGRLVAGTVEGFATGQDMKNFAIARDFVEQSTQARVKTATQDFVYTDSGSSRRFLGTYSLIPNLQWAVIAQKDQRDAYAGVYEMQRYSRVLAIAVVILSILVSYLTARRITLPLQVLTETSRAIAAGDFTQRVELRSRTEIGELAKTFNTMSEDLERFVFDLKRAADENRGLFLSSIQMIAGAVDEKDPYTRGHSDRVTKYSVAIAQRLGLPESEVEKIRIAAQLHDVGKIGIEDAVLKKPGALTPTEYEIMKTHTTKGANILRSVEQLREMLPGIELHHESLDGLGYPHGLKGDDIPLMARIITVADTFDAMTTNRPYQMAMETEYVVQRIKALVGTKFDPSVVGALEAAFVSGEIKPRRTIFNVPATAVAAGAGSSEQS